FDGPYWAVHRRGTAPASPAFRGRRQRHAAAAPRLRYSPQPPRPQTGPTANTITCPQGINGECMAISSFDHNAALLACAQGDQRALQTLYRHEAPHMLALALK